MYNIVVRHLCNLQSNDPDKEFVTDPSHVDLDPGLSVPTLSETLPSLYLLLSLYLTSPMKRNENILFSLTYLFSKGSVKTVENMQTWGTWWSLPFYKYFWLSCDIYSFFPKEPSYNIIESIDESFFRQYCPKQYCWVLGYNHTNILPGIAQCCQVYISSNNITWWFLFLSNKFPDFCTSDRY